MKKLLPLTLAIALGLTCNVFAAAPANPFDDIPQNHWAYSAASQLAKDGLIDGYGDKTFRGNQPITRYEMAMIVAKAMSKSSKSASISPETKAALNKLEGEFSGELDKLGVRLKAVEAKVDNVKFDGEMQTFFQQRGAESWYNEHASWGNGPEHGGTRHDNTMTTTQLKLRGHLQISDDFTVHTEIAGGHNYRTGESFVTGNSGSNTNLTNNKDTFMKLYWEGPIFGANTYFGRFDPKEKSGFNQYYDPMFWDVGLLDGAKFEFGNKIKTTLFVGKANDACAEFDGIGGANVKYNALRFDTQAGNMNLWLMYHDVTPVGDSSNTATQNKQNFMNSGWGKEKATAYEFHFGTPIQLPIPGKWYTWSNIISTNALHGNRGYHVGLSYNDPPDRKIPGQWGAWTMFHKQESYSALNPFGEAKSWEIDWGAHKGFQGWEVGVNYVPFVNQRIMIREIIGKPSEDRYAPNGDGTRMGNQKAFRIEWDMDF